LQVFLTYQLQVDKMEGIKVQETEEDIQHGQNLSKKKERS